jgi:CrcB protein
MGGCFLPATNWPIHVASFPSYSNACATRAGNEIHHAVRFSQGNEVSQNRWIARLMTSANLTSSARGRTRQTMSYLWVTVGSALGGLLRYAISRLMLSFDVSIGFPIGTVLINVIGSFVIGYFGTLTLHSGKYPASDNVRLFVMVGICGGFTTFSSFSLQTLDLMRSDAWGRALANIALSVALCLTAVAVGHRLAQHWVPQIAIAETDEEEYTG